MPNRLLQKKKRMQGQLPHGISLLQAAKFLQVEQSILYTAIQKGEIPTCKRDGRTVVSQGALMEYRARKQTRFDY